MQIIPMEGQTCGRWTIMSRGKTDKRKRIYWLCRCECGTEREVEGVTLRSGASKACGCYSADVARLRETTHGGTGTPLFGIWRGMMTRCYNPATLSYEDYGQRGITVSERWQRFENFFSDMSPRLSPQHTLDRIDNDEGYSKENCR